MSEVFQTYRALPSHCNSSLGTMVTEEDKDEMVTAYCSECEERHNFVPSSDE